MAGFVIDLFIWVALCGLSTAVWVLTAGSTHELSRMASDPSLVRLSFWPIWVYLAGAAVLVIHLGFVFGNGVFGRRAVQRRRRMAVQAARAMHDGLRQATSHHRAPTPANAGGGPRREWVTVMFTDIVGSTTLNERLGDDEWRGLLVAYRDIARQAFAARGGEEVGTQGDGFLARFPSPADAVLCAVDIQRDLDDARAEVASTPEVRIGIHAGEAVHDDGDLLGRVVNLAARVTSSAAAGEILVTEPVADYLGGRLELDDRGLHPLRGVTQPRHLLSVRWRNGA